MERLKAIHRNSTKVGVPPRLKGDRHASPSPQRRVAVPSPGQRLEPSSHSRLDGLVKMRLVEILRILASVVG